MRYLSKEDIKGVLTDRDFADLTDGVDDVVFEAVGRQAEAEVDGYLRGRYVLPLHMSNEQLEMRNEADDVIKVIVLDIFRFRLYQRRRPERITDDLIKMYDRAIFRLKDIQAGKLVISNEKLEMRNEQLSSNNLIVLDNKIKKFGFNFTNM